MKKLLMATIVVGFIALMAFVYMGDGFANPFAINTRTPTPSYENTATPTNENTDKPYFQNTAIVKITSTPELCIIIVADAHFRKEPRVASNYVDSSFTFKLGMSPLVLGQSGDGLWKEVEYNNRIGYIKGEYCR